MLRASLVFVAVACVVCVVSGCPTSVDVNPVDAGPQVPDGGPGDEGEGEGDGGEGEGANEGEGEGPVGEGEGEGIIIIGEGEGEGEGEGDVGVFPVGTSPRSVDVGGVERTLELVVPPAINEGRPLPLVIALHGNGDDAANFAGFLGFEGVAGVADAVFAVLDGVEQDVDVGGFPVSDVYWDAYSDAAVNDDIAFLDAVIAALVATGGVDEDSVHVFGYSQGGFMAYRYALERSAVVASAVVVGAGDPFNDDHLVDEAARPLPFQLRCGENDGLLPVCRTALQKLTNGGHEVSLNVVPGAGHSPFPVAPGETTTAVVQQLINFQLARPLP